MKKVSALLSLLCLVVFVRAQENTAFMKAANWREVADKAKKENKHILVDFYATWCAPCKYMDKQILSLPEVDNYLKENFVSVKIQMDKTKADGPEVKSWYRDAKSIDDKYAIGAYPTYMIFTPDGKAAHRIVGTTKTGEEFIGKIKEALLPEKQYYTVMENYKKHHGDSAYLREAVKTALKSSDRKYAALIGDEYISSIKDPFAKDNIAFIRAFTNSTKSKGFAFFRDYPERVDAALGKGIAEAKITDIVFTEEVKPSLEEGAGPLDLKDMRKRVEKAYPMVSDKSIRNYEMRYFVVKKLIPEWDEAVLAYVKKYGPSFTALEYNNTAWDVVLFTHNKNVLAEALKWSEKALELESKTPTGNYGNYIDTYANLLYKMGNKDDALKWERKALEIYTQNKEDKKMAAASATIAKMEEGVATYW